MIIRLTTGQFQVLRDDFGVHPWAKWLAGGRIVSDRTIEVSMPAIGWHSLRNRLMSQVYGPAGGRRAVSRRKANTLRRIGRGLARIEVHPALRELGLAGTHSDVIPAWRVDDERRTYSPYPIIGARYYVLSPRWEVRQGLPITYWLPTDDITGMLYDEIEHLAFGPYEPRVGLE